MIWIKNAEKNRIFLLIAFIFIIAQKIQNSSAICKKSPFYRKLNDLYNINKICKCFLEEKIFKKL